MAKFIVFDEYLFDEAGKSTGEKQRIGLNIDHIVSVRRRPLRFPVNGRMIEKEVYSLWLDKGENKIVDISEEFKYLFDL